VINWIISPVKADILSKAGIEGFPY